MLLATAALAALVSACGGSGSETPPPLEPELSVRRSAGAASAEPELLPLPGSEVGDEEPFDDDPGSPRQPPSTWGKADDVAEPPLIADELSDEEPEPEPDPEQ